MRPATGAPSDAVATAARRAVREIFFCEHLLWLGSAARAERRVDIFLDPTSEDYHYVLSQRIAGTLVPESISAFPHIPYDGQLIDGRPPNSAAIGAYAFVETIHSAARRARFHWNGDILETPVIADHAVLVAWDTPWLPTDRQPRAIALLIDGHWTPTVSTVVAATAADFGACYARDHGVFGAARDPSDNWAASAFYDNSTFAERIAMANRVIDTPGVSDFALDCLAAGPIEDLIGHDFLDHVMRDEASRARYIPLLHGTYWNREPPDIQERMRQILGVVPAGAT